MTDGFELYLSQPANPATVVPGNFTVQQKFWVRQVTYGTGAGSYVDRTVSSATLSNDSLRVHLTVPGILRINQSKHGDTTTHWVTHFLVNNLVSSGSAANFTNEAWYAQNWISTRTWNATAPTPTPTPTSLFRERPLSPLESHVWYTVGVSGLLRVNVDLNGAYQALLRDLQGRVLSRQNGTGAGHLDFSAPSHVQSLYLLEVKQGSNSYAHVVTF